MSELPRKILSEIINQNGTALCNDIKRCEDLLLDKCSGEYKREVFLLINALKEGITTDLLNPDLTKHWHNGRCKVGLWL